MSIYIVYNIYTVVVCIYTTHVSLSSHYTHTSIYISSPRYLLFLLFLLFSFFSLLIPSLILLYDHTLSSWSLFSALSSISYQYDHTSNDMYISIDTQYVYRTVIIHAYRPPVHPTYSSSSHSSYILLASIYWYRWWTLRWTCPICICRFMSIASTSTPHTIYSIYIILHTVSYYITTVWRYTYDVYTICEYIYYISTSPVQCVVYSTEHVIT